MASAQDIESLIIEPREDLDVEYKQWLDLANNEHRAIFAKAAIALVNHGGGFIVIGFSETGSTLVSQKKPDGMPDITQDLINGTVRRFATPEFHCELHAATHPSTKVVHPIVVVPGTLTEPAMSKRDHSGIIAQNRCYIRKPGPRSEEPLSGEEWRKLLNRCIRAGREDMLEAIRSIVSGRVDSTPSTPSALQELLGFCDSSKKRWEDLTAAEEVNAPTRFPLGHYEMGFSLVNAQPAAGLPDLLNRLREARRIKLTGWTPFLEMNTEEWAPYPYENFVEAWIGRDVPDRPLRDAAHSDFWRASIDGKLYTIRGYKEDATTSLPEGKLIDVTLPVWRIGEGLLFAHRLSEAFSDVENIAIFCRFTGLKGRRLTSVSEYYDFYGNEVSRSDQIQLSKVVTLGQVKDNLVEVLFNLLSPLYERFNFFQLPLHLVEAEVAKMAKGRF